MFAKASHKVGQNENLEGIARKYGFSSYKPILIYNNKVLKRVNIEDPDRIKAGSVLMIPHQERGYDDMIIKLEDLIVQFQQDRQEVIDDLNAARNEAETVGKRVDLASDLIFIGKGGFKFVGKGVTKVSAVLGKRQTKLLYSKQSLKAVNAIAHHVADEVLGDDGHEGAQFVLKSAGDVVADNSILTLATGSMPLNKMAGSAGKIALKKVVETGCSAAFKMALAEEKARSAEFLTDGICKMVAVASTTAGTGMSKLGNVLEAINPSKIAKMAVFLMTGEHPDNVYRSALANVNQSFELSIAKYRARIEDLQNEKALLFR